MAILYGTLRGRVDRYKREDHVVDTPSAGPGPRRDRPAVADRRERAVRRPVRRRLLGGRPARRTPDPGGLDTLATGFTPQPPDSRHALDYVKAPLFDLALGRVLPPSGAASADDLQDLLSLYLDQCKAAGGEIFAFGAKFAQNLHKTDRRRVRQHRRAARHPRHPHESGQPRRPRGRQRRLPRRRAHPRFADRHVGLFLAFQTQRVPTDATGFPAPDARPLSAVIGNPGPTSGPPSPAIYIAHALINPTGADPGQEVVVLANLATTPRTLGGWTLTDRNGRTTAIDVTIPAGAAMPIATRRHAGAAGQRRRQPRPPRRQRHDDRLRRVQQHRGAARESVRPIPPLRSAC